MQPQLLEDGSIRIVPHFCEASKTGQTVGKLKEKSS